MNRYTPTAEWLVYILAWVDNCSQEQNSLAGGQCALGKIDPES